MASLQVYMQCCTIVINYTLSGAQAVASQKIILKNASVFTYKYKPMNSNSAPNTCIGVCVCKCYCDLLSWVPTTPTL